MTRRTPFTRNSLSLRTQLYLWLLAPMALLMIASGWIARGNAVQLAHAVSDRMLLGSARMIGESIASEAEHMGAELPPAALENLQAGYGDRVYYRVDGPKEGVLLGFSTFPAYPRALAPERWESFDTSFRDEPVRAVAFAQPVYPFEPDSVVVVQVATTLQAHDALVTRLWLRSLWPQALLLVAVAALGWFWVRYALAPVTRISAEVRNRDLESSETIPPERAPLELRPLVRAVNEYIERISRYVGERNRFISNAAHQLKTPITVLNTQITVGLRSAEGEQKQHALQAGYQTVQHCIRLIHQLLTLSSTDHTLLPRIAPSDVDLGELVRGVLEDLAELAHRKNVDLGLSPDEQSVPVRAVPLLLRELIANLVDNAIRYTPEGGTVTVSLRVVDGTSMLEVEDTGPGIPAAQREHVFERFYRLPETSQHEGSGLGLAIVREIAIACGAQVALLDRPDGERGLLVQVRFPAPAGIH